MGRIHGQVREAILAGTLPESTRLPPERTAGVSWRVTPPPRRLAEAVAALRW
jgi:DNA-binding FadR family transcriptional regulator